MSRSRKRVACIKDKSKNQRIEKRRASKKIRRSENVDGGKAYRKHYPIYELCDYKLYLWSPVKKLPWREKKQYVKK